MANKLGHVAWIPIEITFLSRFALWPSSYIIHRYVYYAVHELGNISQKKRML